MRDKINDDLKTAMKAGDKDRVGTLRLINSAIKSADIDARPKDKISDADILTVMAKMIKQRRNSIEQFTAGGRPELAAKEAAEITVIEGYMPAQMGEADAKAAIAAVIRRRLASPRAWARSWRPQGQVRRPDGLRQGQRPHQRAAEVTPSSQEARHADHHFPSPRHGGAMLRMDAGEGQEGGVHNV